MSHTDDATPHPLVEFARWLKAKASPHSAASRLYAAGLASLVGAIGLALVRADQASVVTLFYASTLLCGGGMLRELYIWSSPLVSSPFVKLVGGLLFVSTAAVSAGMSAYTVAITTGQDPSTFKTTIALLAPMAFLPFVALASIVVGLISLPVVMLLEVGLPSLRGKKGHPHVLIGRLFGLLSIVSISSMSISAPHTPIEKVTARIAGWSAFHLDMFPDAGCAPSSADRVVRINDSLVIVGTKTVDGFAFYRRECPLAAQTPPNSGDPSP